MSYVVNSAIPDSALAATACGDSRQWHKGNLGALGSKSTLLGLRLVQRPFKPPPHVRIAGNYLTANKQHNHRHARR